LTERKLKKAKRMISSSFPLSTHIALVADASVVINLNATGRAADIIKAIGSPFFVTKNASSELANGSAKGHRDHDQLLELIDFGYVRTISLQPAGLRIYESLIKGSTTATLDDGEAATIACAHEISAIALIDERKARALCRASFPKLPVLCAAELLMHDLIAEGLGADGRMNALLNALTVARMRVPPELLLQVTNLIGAERAAKCLSLPKTARQSAV
jgi:predicted nucleic acid-binding protein